MVNSIRVLWQRFITWREHKISERNFILGLSFLIGILTALAAMILKFLIHFIQEHLTYNFSETGVNWSYLLYPAIGILLAGWLARNIVRDDISHGITKILYAISRRQGRIKRHNIWSSTVASSITIGLGGSVGAEAPIVLTGSAIGSNLGSLFNLERRTLMLLVGCGAAGAIAGIFKAPIAGLVFTIEVLMIDLTMTSLLPLLISSVTAATLSYIVTGQEAIFKFHLDQPFELGRIPYVILLGVACGLVSLYCTRTMNALEGVFAKWRNPYKRWLWGALILGILIFFFPSLYGEGYNTIELLLNGTNGSDWDTVMDHSLFYGHGDLLLFYLILIVIFKIVATSATNGGGGCGGVFAPSLFLGCIVGFVFSSLSNHITFIPDLPEKNFALMGMAGVMSGVMHAPLTGVFLIAELTGGYDLFLPLIIVSVSSYLTIIIFEPHSIYSMRLAKKGELLTHHKDKAILTLMKVSNIVETDLVVVHPEMDLGELVQIISAKESRRSLFPVVNKSGVLLGIVSLDDIRNIMFRQELYHRFKVDKLMNAIPARLYDTYNMGKIMRIFDDTNAWNLPVVNSEGKYLGMISKSKIFSSYRQMLVQLSDE
ncbi:Voltage-gated ClC-type chloride channel ClcB [termite gut metagenome]|uniref:Voltage-gated ClC-type chloride channel ClcB n=1 Tax=termite gut metagenome TaxID=433724 RepID=A0A5J4RX30_9ZZZZ